jgi:hypothetical protein
MLSRAFVDAPCFSALAASGETCTQQRGKQMTNESCSPEGSRHDNDDANDATRSLLEDEVFLNDRTDEIRRDHRVEERPISAATSLCRRRNHHTPRKRDKIMNVDSILTVSKSSLPRG